jgi:hypothetical protein
MLKRLFKRANNETQPEPPSVGEIVAQPRVDEVVEKPRVIRKLILVVLGVIVIINLTLALGAFPFSRSCYHQRERGISHLFQHVPASSFVEGAEHEYFLGIILTPKDTRPFEA